MKKEAVIPKKQPEPVWESLVGEMAVLYSLPYLRLPHQFDSWFAMTVFFVLFEEMLF